MSAVDDELEDLGVALADRCRELKMNDSMMAATIFLILNNQDRVHIFYRGVMAMAPSDVTFRKAFSHVRALYEAQKKKGSGPSPSLN